MKRIGSFLKGIVSNPITTTLGTAMVGGSGYQLYQNPALLATAQGVPLVLGVLGGLGLIASADSKPKGAADSQISDEQMQQILASLPQAKK